MIVALHCDSWRSNGVAIQVQVLSVAERRQRNARVLLHLRRETRSVKGGAGKGAGRGKHAAAKSGAVRTSATRKAGPKKTARKTTTRSGDK
jgi:hypothetical protein